MRALWFELFRLSWRREPRPTVTALTLIALSVVMVAVTTISLRAAVDATSRDDRNAAVLAAGSAAVAYALSIVIQTSIDSAVTLVLDRVGRLGLHARIHQLIGAIEGIEHLERTDFLDRLTVLRTASGKIMAWAWHSVLAGAGVLELAVMLSLLGSVDPWLLLMLLFAAVPIRLNNRGQRHVAAVELASAEQFRLQQQLFDLATQPATAKEIMVSEAGTEMIRRQSQAWQRAQRQRLRAQLTAAAWKFAGWVLFTTFFVVAIGLVVCRGTLGDLVLVVTTALAIRQILHNTVSSALRTAGARRYLEPYLWLRDYARAQRVIDAGHLEAPPRLRHGIRLDGLSFTYPDATEPALTDVDLHLPAGSVVAIVGEYGSGKTTLVKLLLKFYRPGKGRILADGTDLAQVDTAAWRRRTSAAFQDFARFHTTLGETVGVGDLAAIDDQDRILEALASADGRSTAERLPAGLATQLGAGLGGAELSEGQWQRTALARASMRQDPLLFILDEPTASLDAAAEQQVFQRYLIRARHLAAETGAVTVIVSHRFSTVADADLIVVLDHGRVAETGSHAELLRKEGQYAALYKIQLDAYS